MAIKALWAASMLAVGVVGALGTAQAQSDPTKYPTRPV